MKTDIPKSLSSQKSIYLILVIVFMSCLDFQFQSEYEDINGIYLEQVAAYNIHGEKIITDGDLGYIINDDSLLIFDFTNADSIVPLGAYSDYGYIRDFAVEGDYAYLVANIGLEIVHMQGSSANLTGLLGLPSLYEIRALNDRAYIISGEYRRTIIVVDVSDKTNPVLIDSILFDNVIAQIEVDSSFAYVLLSDHSFHVIEINEPSLTVHTLSNDTGDIFVSFIPDGDYVHFSCWVDAFKLMTFTIADNYEFNQISEIDCPIGFYELQISGWYGLGLSNTHVIYLFELKDHMRPYIAERLELTTTTSGTIEGDYIYILSPLMVVQIKHIEQ